MSISQLIEQLLQNMIMVEGGTLQMNDRENGNPTTITVNDFKIGKYLITQEQWTTVMSNNPSHFNSKGNETHPVEKVSWDDVQGFIKKLNESTDKNFRLPTEAEWKFAERGGIKSKGHQYAGSDDLDSVAWYHKNSDEKTHPVGAKNPNELGIYDMNGNVFEWCEDIYNENSIGSGNHRMTCGGSWFEKIDEYRYHKTLPHSLSTNDVGFRLVCD